MANLEKIVEKQKKFFNTHKTLDVNFRILQLKRLKLQIRAYYEQILSAFVTDMNKKEFDVVSTEVGLIMSEINYMVKHLKSLSKEKKKGVSLMNFPGKIEIIREPYGVVCICSPWNYPLHLAFMPLVGAIAGGNTVILKPSRKTPNVTEVIKKMLSIFDDEYVYVVTNEKEIEELFSTKFDYIFYTGSKIKAQELMEKQASFLTPMTLELGGKSPAIIDKDAKIDISAKRTIWGKFVNGGQTCIAPDYVLLHSSIKDKWLESAVKYIKKFYYKGEGELSDNYVKYMGNMENLTQKIDKEKIYFGGNIYKDKLEPTILTNVTRNDEIMKEEIFASVLPVIEFDDLDKELKILQDLDKPLALYYFGEDKESIYKVKNYVSFGNGAINDTVIHIGEHNLPFGGVGASGIGSYHAKKSFETFTHEKGILKKSSKIDLPFRYPPENKKRIKFAKKYFKI